MVLRFPKYTSYEGAFFFIWALYGVQYTLLSASELPFMFNLDRIRQWSEYTVLCLQLSLFFMNYRLKRREMIKYILLMLLITLIEFSLTSKSLLIMTLFIITAQPIEFKKIVRFDVKIKLPLFLLLVLLATTGIINNYQVTINGLYKQAYGFAHPNTFTCFAFVILLEIMYLRYQQMNWMDWVFQIVCSLIVFQVGGGRTSSYTYFVILFLFWIAKVKPQVYTSGIVKFLFLIITPLMGAISLLGAYLYSRGNSLMLAINRMLTGRLLMSSQMMSQYGVKLFGQELELISGRNAKLNNVTSIILDCAYMRCLLMYGVVFFVMFIVVYMLLFRRLLTMRHTSLALFALFFVLLGLGEAYMLNITYNLTLLVFLKSKKEIVKETPIVERMSVVSIERLRGMRRSISDSV